MIKKLFILLAVLNFLAYAQAETEQVDTIISASTADELTIQTDKNEIDITLKNIDGTGDNFYYKTSVSDQKDLLETVITRFKDVTDVRILEISGKAIKIEFANSVSPANSISYQIPDPENRIVRTYTGRKFKNFGINLSRKGKSSWNLCSKGLGVGWNHPLNSTPELSTNFGRSSEWGWLMALGVGYNYGRHTVSAGLGFDWRNYSLSGANYFNKEDGGPITLLPFEEGVNKGKSRIQIYSLQIPLLYNIRFGRNNIMGFELGPVLNFNIDGNIKTEYEIGSRKYEITTNKIGQKPVTLDLFAAYHIWGIAVYARYAPMKMFRQSAGLQFNSLSTGLMILF